MSKPERLIEYEGEKLPVSVVAMKIGITKKTLQWRLRNMPLEKALTSERINYKMGRPKGSGAKVYEWEGRFYTIKELAEKFVVSESRLRRRLAAMPIEKALDFEKKINITDGAWTSEESSYLCEVYKMPGLPEHWNTHAKKNGWKTRTRDSLHLQIRKLRELGMLGNMNKVDESDGWMSVAGLSNCLNVPDKTIARWVDDGAPIYRNNTTAHAVMKVHIKHFVDWAISPVGAEVLAKHLHQNRVGLYWLLLQIGNWVEGKAPVVAQKYHAKNVKKKFEKTIDTQSVARLS